MCNTDGAKRGWLLSRGRRCQRLQYQGGVLEVLFQSIPEEEWNRPGRQEHWWEEVFSPVKEVKIEGHSWKVNWLEEAFMSDHESVVPGYVMVVFQVSNRGGPVDLENNVRPIFVFTDGEEWQAS